MDIENDIITRDGENEFQIRIIKSEEIGLVTTRTEKHFLILDSSDYWYDAIQNGYPKIKKCTCKNEWFTLKFKYYYREHYDDIKRIEVKTFCINCGKIVTILNIEIKYSSTEHLVKNPLVYCKNPKIKCNNKTIELILETNDFDKMICYLSETGFIIYCWYWNANIKKREFKMVEPKEIKQINKILRIYISQNALDIADIDITSPTNESGIYIKERLWRMYEVIEIGNIYLCNVGMIYRLDYSTQFIDNNGAIMNKSKEFVENIIKMEKWINENYRNEK
jgi:hypothetical protein